jgi:hypothetical protein
MDFACKTGNNASFPHLGIVGDLQISAIVCKILQPHSRNAHFSVALSPRAQVHASLQ